MRDCKRHLCLILLLLLLTQCLCLSVHRSTFVLWVVCSLHCLFSFTVSRSLHSPLLSLLPDCEGTTRPHDGELTDSNFEEEDSVPVDGLPVVGGDTEIDGGRETPADRGET